MSTNNLRDRISALFRQPPGEERLGDQTPGEIADAILAVVTPELDRLRDSVRELEAELILRAMDSGVGELMQRAERAEEEAERLRGEVAEARRERDVAERGRGGNEEAARRISDALAEAWPDLREDPVYLEQVSLIAARYAGRATIEQRQRAERAEVELAEREAVIERLQVAADPTKVGAIEKLVRHATRLVQIERDEARQRAERAEARLLDFAPETPRDNA